MTLLSWYGGNMAALHTMFWPYGEAEGASSLVCRAEWDAHDWLLSDALSYMLF